MNFLNRSLSLIFKIRLPTYSSIFVLVLTVYVLSFPSFVMGKYFSSLNDSLSGIGTLIVKDGLLLSPSLTLAVNC